MYTFQCNLADVKRSRLLWLLTDYSNLRLILQGQKGEPGMRGVNAGMKVGKIWIEHKVSTCPLLWKEKKRFKLIILLIFGFALRVHKDFSWKQSFGWNIWNRRHCCLILFSWILINLSGSGPNIIKQVLVRYLVCFILRGQNSFDCATLTEKCCYTLFSCLRGEKGEPEKREKDGNFSTKVSYIVPQTRSRP